MDGTPVEHGFTCVGTIDQFRRGRGRVVRVGDNDVAVFHTRDGWYALLDSCPHMGASLAGGRIDGHTVECAWHHWQFDMRDGISKQRDWACASVYELRIVDRSVWLRPRPAEQSSAPPVNEESEQEWIAWDDSFFKKKTDPD